MLTTDCGKKSKETTMFCKVRAWMWTCCAAACVLSRAVEPAPAPAAMFQHATSSQSVVFRQPARASHQPPPSAISAPRQSDDTLPQYEYKYEVSDQQTGDRKSHWESRHGDLVRGSYTLVEPDGGVRKVDYTADSRHGFNAVVTRNGQVKHPAQSHGTFSNTINSEYGTQTKSYGAGEPFGSLHPLAEGGSVAGSGRSPQDVNTGYNINHSSGAGKILSLY